MARNGCGCHIILDSHRNCGTQTLLTSDAVWPSDKHFWWGTVAAFLFPGFVLFAICCLAKCFVPRELVSWSLEEFNMCIYGYGCAFNINHCSLSWLKTSASIACFVQSRSKHVCSLSSWHHGGETGACQGRSDTAERARGHKNHNNPEFDIVEQQLTPLLSWFSTGKLNAASYICEFKDFMVYLCVQQQSLPLAFHFHNFIVLISSAGAVCCSSFLSAMKNNVSSPEHHPKQSITGNMTAYGLCQCFSLIIPLCAKQCGFISALHYATLCSLSITSHPQKDLEVSWRK